MTTTPLRTSTTTDHSTAGVHAIFILREVVAECERRSCSSPAVRTPRCSCTSRLRLRAQQLPFPVMHIDTGQNFPEVIEFRDATVKRVGARLVVAKVQDTIDQARSKTRRHGFAQPTADGDVARRHPRQQLRRRFRGARRDEDKARAKERILSFRDTFGQWDLESNDPNCGRSIRAR